MPLKTKEFKVTEADESIIYAIPFVFATLFFVFMGMPLAARFSGFCLSSAMLIYATM